MTRRKRQPATKATPHIVFSESVVVQSVQWRQMVEIVVHGQGSLIGPSTTLPIPPQIGMYVGQLKIKSIRVNQADGSNIIEYVCITSQQAKELMMIGWTKIS
jgi:hypothetical protein